jgi:hypothetical protein
MHDAYRWSFGVVNCQGRGERRGVRPVYLFREPDAADTVVAILGETQQLAVAEETKHEEPDYPIPHTGLGVFQPLNWDRDAELGSVGAGPVAPFGRQRVRERGSARISARL